MARTDLKLKTKDQATGNVTTTSITHVNENADSATLLQFSQMLNNLTTNTYNSTDRVQTINVDTEEVPVEYPEYDFSVVPETFTISKSNINVGGITEIGSFGITGASIITSTGTKTLGSTKCIPFVDSGKVYIITTSDYTPTAGTTTIVFFFVPSGSHYKPVKFTRTLQITD